MICDGDTCTSTAYSSPRAATDPQQVDLSAMREDLDEELKELWESEGLDPRDLTWYPFLDGTKEKQRPEIFSKDETRVKESLNEAVRAEFSGGMGG